MTTIEIGFASLQKALLNVGARLSFTCIKENDEAPWEFACRLDGSHGPLGCKIIKGDEMDIAIECGEGIKAKSPDKLFEKVLEIMDLEKNILWVWKNEQMSYVPGIYKGYGGKFKYNFELKSFQDARYS